MGAAPELLKVMFGIFYSDMLPLKSKQIYYEFTSTYSMLQNII